MTLKHVKEQAIFLGVPLELSAVAGAATDTLPSKFSGVAYSGGIVPGMQAVIDLSSTTVAAKMHMLNEHTHADIVGVIDQSSNNSHNITVAGKLFSDMAGSSSERIAKLAQRGSPYELSVGIYGFKTDEVKTGEVEVNGQKFAAPITVLRGGKVREVSVVALGADWNTEVQMFSQQNTPEPKQELSMTEAEINALKQQVTDLTAAAAARAAADVEAQRIAKVEASVKRGAAIAALELAVGGEKFSDSEKTAFANMGDVEFSAMGDRMKAQVARLRALDPALFADQATGDTKKADQIRAEKAQAILSDPHSIYEKRAKLAAETKNAFRT